MSGCVFCQIVAGDAVPGGDDKTVRVIGSAVVFAPVAPVVPGHVLIVPMWHVSHAAERPETTAETFGAAAEYAQGCRGAFNLITSSGREATQTVDHLHVHYVPRADGDGLPLPWTPQHAAATGGSDV